MATFGHGWWLVAATFVVAVAVTYLTDRFALPRKVAAGALGERQPGQAVIDMAARIPAVALIYALFFAISWRPYYALTAVVSTFFIFTAISRAKYEFIREPLVFSDIALVLLVFRHKTMFYATWLNLVFWCVALGYVFGASALFMIYEPSLLPSQGRLILISGMVMAAAAPWLFLYQPGYRHAISRISSALTGKDGAIALTARLGTFASVLYGFLAWLKEPTAPVSVPASAGEGRDLPMPNIGKGEEENPLLVVWQSESFMDMRHFGVSPLSLPNLDRLRSRAAEWGRMSSIFEGGYTLRTEFSVITGLPPDDLGPDAAHPYLRAGAYSEAAWPNRLRRAGWSTRFLHPYDRQFFSRDRALPQLGFETLSMLEEFEKTGGAAGAYVSDMTLAERVLEYCREGSKSTGQFIFAASIENHGPWQPGRHEGCKHPLDIYLAILQRSDEALGFLADELDRLDRPVWLAFYGDHAPLLKSFSDPFPDPRTDYLIVPLARAGAGSRPAKTATEKAPWQIIADTLRHMATEQFDRRAVEARQ
ncbi:LTA synthase family protein [Pseudaminobacter sp. 19-2017]|uniref:LTA synthase family protein n=1 Tax=Pseudaminobacter soli (ex Zhang et al. 2022) TaxID=2831468 RepID=A0A942E1W7_9HYPH|nr:LTA synthase family protein [Pseudaminobacter soli]MBS3649511.1 LTA synthase family protein [Pseudaminobacter soli]